jgi:hypothetical protein
MTGHALSSPMPRVTRGPLFKAMACGAAAAVMALAGVGVDKLANGSPHRLSVPLYTAPGKVFRIAQPKGWRALTPTQLRTLRPQPTAVLRRTDGRGTIVVRPAPVLRGTPAQVIGRLPAQLSRRFRGFKPVSARVAHLRGGAAIVYTFVRDPKATAQTLVIAPASGRLWEIDAVVPAGAAPAARQVGAMLATFGS